VEGTYGVLCTVLKTEIMNGIELIGSYLQPKEDAGLFIRLYVNLDLTRDQ